MVGRQTLNLVIGVRVPVPEQGCLVLSDPVPNCREGKDTMCEGLSVALLLEKQLVFVNGSVRTVQNELRTPPNRYKLQFSG